MRVSEIQDAEGGNIIVEHMTFDTQLQKMFVLPEGVSAATRVMAYFMSAQTPSINPLPAVGECNNLVATHGWPLWVGTPHTDIDVGALTITGKNATDMNVSFEIPKKLGGTDLMGRSHDVFYQLFMPDAPALLRSDSSYSVVLGGSTSFLTTTYANMIYLAAGYASVESPDLEDDGPLVDGVDYPVHWTNGTSLNKPAADRLVGSDIFGITWLLDVSGSPTHMCVGAASDGTFTIPGSTITEYKALAAGRSMDSTHAILVRSALAHQLSWLPLAPVAQQRHRLDQLGMESWAQLMNVQ